MSRAMPLPSAAPVRDENAAQAQAAMRPRHRSSITRRLVCMFILLGTLVFAASGVWLYQYLERTLLEQISGELEFRHSLLDPLLAASGTPEQWATVRRKLGDLGGRDSRTRYWVLGENPAYTFGSGPAQPEWLGKPEGISIIPNLSGGRAWVIFTRLLPAHGERPAIRFVTVSDCTPYFQTLGKFRQSMVLTYLVGLVLIALLAYGIARFGLAPLRRLSAQARNLPVGSFSQRLDVPALPAELCELATAFNGALARQEAAWQQLEAFNANVAHELRTPLGNLMGQTQVMLAQRRSVEELENLLGSNIEEIERLTGIVNDMLFLSCAGSGQRAADLSRVSLRAEALKTIDYLEPVFADYDVDVVVSGDTEASIDRRLFHRALGNLLQNGARHAEPGSSLEVLLSREGSDVVAAVANVGEQIPPEVEQRLFERFYRADSSRAQSDMHHGLGLSIVAAVARMHGGTASARREQGRNIFVFTMQAGI
ncbi:heavy metal sensor histidine kinase [Kerstersia gyiorum]|uniref:heavy metal sensor histidine kinase n=1 Tax=Kerstersia gyiorum TaxID=206506 RepID=UPI0020A0EC8D|nr:heavy metal sensor histidine kinase [Kerstersia gyiorum]MCP1634273.1 two-component system heavy metal sensor histidine kinase CusS [Kerstersia gyiorum]MCP1638191.1 two-component system heavy metal sensor histidine kinase CusS [Kerstersia gyiorum]MCP1672781.1 two-component system heavy metal sensor histidine kinase CusS [Kerstersia gyiorum]MCP1680076.1 two-component system heavy metal sensor histidine kinase CusS [Kerstersia gyiorum]MCP1683574.1 two-component system heavy metal sensor histid